MNRKIAHRRRRSIMDLVADGPEAARASRSPPTSTASPSCEGASSSPWRSPCPRGPRLRRRAPRTVAASVAIAGARRSDERLQKVHERREALERELARPARRRRRASWARSSGSRSRCASAASSSGETQILLQRTNAQLDATLAQGAGSSRRVPRRGAARRSPPTPGPSTSWARSRYLRMLLSVDRPSDFFRGYRFVTTLARRDNERVAALPRRPDGACDHEGRRSSRRRRRRSRCAAEPRAGAPQPRRRARAQDGAAHLARREEGAERRLRRGAGGGRGASCASCSRASTTGDVAVPLGAFRGALPWPVAGRGAGPASGSRKHPRFDTYTIQNGIEIEAAPETPGRGRPRGHGGLRRPVQGLRPHGRPRPRRQAPHALRPPGGGRRCRWARRWRPGRRLGTTGAGLRGARPVLRDALPGPAGGPRWNG